MRLFYFVKWLLIAAIFCVTLLLATPFVYFAAWLAPAKTQQFFTDLGAQLARNCAVDFAKCRGA